MHPGGPRDGWEKQYKKRHWELNFTNDVSLELPEPLQAAETDDSKWKQSYVYGAGGERLSMTYLPAYDPNNGWEPVPGDGGGQNIQELLERKLIEQLTIILVRYAYDEKATDNIFVGDFRVENIYDGLYHASCFGNSGNIVVIRVRES
ncbi:hypothetical protein [Paenibacillus cookii]|uniref:Uncharacterized protein n=1 Tax=Paenibacillus cookii TaxID=157839 RepID=A0ABQ4LUJ3_9BACL|nr:hypothetical protein [Paenibacillus cookii]GIO66603.1 hypothetical protein J21TS3_14240 [Paenibacillus cookii]